MSEESIIKTKWQALLCKLLYEKYTKQLGFEPDLKKLNGAVYLTINHSDILFNISIKGTTFTLPFQVMYADQFENNRDFVNSYLIEGIKEIINK